MAKRKTRQEMIWTERGTLQQWIFENYTGPYLGIVDEWTDNPAYFPICLIFLN